MMMNATNHESWLLSYYRSSEIDGALFFGRLARAMRPGLLQQDMTKHFADESQHASFWTQCIQDMGIQSYKLNETYQNEYVEEGGMPSNMMEVLAVTLAFERRVIRMYVAHSQVQDLAPPLRSTLDKIMADEKWHIRWVTDALEGAKSEYGEDVVNSTVQRYLDADRKIYQRFLETHDGLVNELKWLKGR
jgi:bacterioferritin (cytochrome b1)